MSKLIKDVITFEELKGYFICFSFYLFIGAIFLDSAPFPELNLIDFNLKENDFDVFLELGSQYWEPLAKTLNKY